MGFVILDLSLIGLSVYNLTNVQNASILLIGQ